MMQHKRLDLCVLFCFFSVCESSSLSVCVFTCKDSPGLQRVLLLRDTSMFSSQSTSAWTAINTAVLHRHYRSSGRPKNPQQKNQAIKPSPMELVRDGKSATFIHNSVDEELHYAQGKCLFCFLKSRDEPCVLISLFFSLFCSDPEHHNNNKPHSNGNISSVFLRPASLGPQLDLAHDFRQQSVIQQHLKTFSLCLYDFSGIDLCVGCLYHTMIPLQYTMLLRSQVHIVIIKASREKLLSSHTGKRCGLTSESVDNSSKLMHRLIQLFNKPGLCTNLSQPC